jgi:hypothetical protein
MQVKQGGFKVKQIADNAYTLTHTRLQTRSCQHKHSFSVSNAHTKSVMVIGTASLITP